MRKSLTAFIVAFVFGIAATSRFDEHVLDRRHVLGDNAKRRIPTSLLSHHLRPAISRAHAQPKSIAGDILQELWAVKKMIHALDGRMEKRVRALANIGTGHSNEQRSEIQSSGDRISQLQKTLNGRVDDLRYNITMLMTSQKEMRQSTETTLQTMIGIIRDLMKMVTEKDSVANSTAPKSFPATKAPSLTAQHSQGVRLNKISPKASISKTVQSPNATISNHLPTPKAVPVSASPATKPIIKATPAPKAAVRQNTTTPYTNNTSRKTKQQREIKHRRDQKQKRGFGARELSDHDIDRELSRLMQQQYADNEEE